jgi:hypothetical protein
METRMATLDTRPDTVDINHYAGDTLTLAIRAPSSYVAGRVWSASVRSTRSAATIDASFSVIVPTVTDGPAYITLSSADTALLGNMGIMVPGAGGLSVKTYTGVWDVQVKHPSGDPVSTLVQGIIKIEADVTRP